MIPRPGDLAIKLAPSILSADVARLAEQVGEAEQGGADRIHVDVMDGHFVPNLTFGPVIVKWLRPVTQLPLEVHLMIDNPDQFLEAFAEAGANTLIVHQEGAIHLNRTVQQIKALGPPRWGCNQPGNARRDATGDPPRSGPGPGHDRQPRLRRSAFPGRHAAEDSYHPPDD